MTFDMMLETETTEFYRPQECEERFYSGADSGDNQSSLVIDVHDLMHIANYVGLKDAVKRAGISTSMRSPADFLSIVAKSDVDESRHNYADAVKSFIMAAQVTHVVLELAGQGFSKNAARILELSQFDDFEDGEKPLSLTSASGFAQFVGKFLVGKTRGLGEPILGMSDTGTLLASWRIAKNRCLLIEFLNEQLVSFSLIAENGGALDGTLRLSGKSLSHEKLQATLKVHGVQEWRKA